MVFQRTENCSDFPDLHETPAAHSSRSQGQGQGRSETRLRSRVPSSLCMPCMNCLLSNTKILGLFWVLRLKNKNANHGEAEGQVPVGSCFYFLFHSKCSPLVPLTLSSSQTQESHPGCPCLFKVLNLISLAWNQACKDVLFGLDFFSIMLKWL